MRIARFLAKSGYGARRKAESLVLAGRVEVNGVKIDSPATNVDVSDVVLVDGKEIRPRENVYYLLNKPAGVTSTASDPHAEKTIIELVPEEIPVWPVGRLDRETEGLIILTNDGDLHYRLTHPSFKKEKEYLAQTDQPLKEQDLLSIRKGIDLDDGPIKPDLFEKIGEKEYRIIIHEGRKRLIRRLFGHFHLEVIKLTRIRLASLGLGDLKPGEWRQLEETEIEELKNV